MKTNKLNILILVVVALCNQFAASQTIVQMVYDGGVYKIPCRVNGLGMDFILDTGASNVCLSMSRAEALLRYGYLSEDDFYGVGYSSIADGSIVDHLKLRIKDIEIGGLHLKNVEAIVIAGQSAPLLMGQSALQKLGSYTINGNKLVINNYTAGEGKRREQLIQSAVESSKKGYYALAISYYVQAEEIYELDYVYLEHLAWCYKRENKYKECYDVCKKWLSLYENLNKRNFNESIYDLFWRCNYYFGYNDQALLYKQKQMLVKSEGVTKTSLGFDQENLGQIFYALGRYDDAISCLTKAISLAAEDNNIKSDLPVIKDNNLLGWTYWWMSQCYRQKADKKKCKKYLELAQKCGNENAIKVCRNKDTREAYFSRGKVPTK